MSMFRQQERDVYLKAKDMTPGRVYDDESDGTRWVYVEILNTATLVGAAGDPVAWGLDDGRENGRVVIDVAGADAKPVCAGFLAGDVEGVAGTPEYGWIQVTGRVATAAAAGAGNDNAVTLSASKTLTNATATDPIAAIAVLPASSVIAQAIA